MKQKINAVVLLILIFGINKITYAQPFQIELTIKNQPDNSILFGWVQGDDFNLIDSAKIDISDNSISFNFPENSHPGTYRLIFGITKYAQIMDEEPQQLDLIFNNENIKIETDFKSPVESLSVIESEENKIWYEFLLKDRQLMSDIQYYEQLVNRYWNTDNEEKAIDAAGKYNQLQLERDVFVKETANQNLGFFVSVYIKNQRKPLLDGYLTELERDEFYKSNFLKNISFSDDRLINSSVYSDNIFEYLTHYNDPEFTMEQRENAYIEAVDVIFQETEMNEKVKQFLMSYVANGFKLLQLDKVIDYLKLKFNFKE